MKTVHLNGYIQVEKYPFIENSESHCNEGFVLFNELGEQFAFCWDNEQPVSYTHLNSTIAICSLIIKMGRFTFNPHRNFFNV